MMIYTVLRSGGDYREEHAEKLYQMCKQHLPDWWFTCLTDMNPNCPSQPLEKKWPGWWSKMEIFDYPGEALYFDLDTIICGDCTKWVESIRGSEFAILRDVYRGRRDPGAVQSSIMYWDGDMGWLYDQFADNPDFSHSHGDQGYIQENVKKPVFIQDRTDQVVSFKADIQDKGYDPANASVVFFHGKPRPWEQNVINY
jgi:hypothetical protein